MIYAFIPAKVANSFARKYFVSFSLLFFLRHCSRTKSLLLYGDSMRASSHSIPILYSSIENTCTLLIASYSSSHIYRPIGRLPGSRLHSESLASPTWPSQVHKKCRPRSFYASFPYLSVTILHRPRKDAAQESRQVTGIPQAVPQQATIETVISGSTGVLYHLYLIRFLQDNQRNFLPSWTF